MASSGSFAVFNKVTRPQSQYSTADQITGGGLSVKGPGSGSFEPVIASISPNSGKWYWEYRAGQGGGSSFGRPSIAVSETDVIKNEDYYGGSNASGVVGVQFNANDGKKRISNSNSTYGSAVSQHDIVQCALDCDNGAVYWGINNTWQNSGDPTSGASKTGAALGTGIQNVNIDIIHTRYNGGGIDQYNFGQDGSFAGAITDAGNSDGNSHGTFKYAPPSGYLALCTANLPIDSGLDPAQTNDDPPVKLFGMLSYTGNAGANSVTGLGFKPDLVWGLNRSASQSKRVLDSSRGGNNYVYLNGASAQVAGNASGDTVEFLDDGIKWNNANGNNDNTVTYAAACWRANGGTTASNTSGTITTTVQTDPPQSFSIVTYTGTGSNATIGHGLSAAPNCVFIKNLSQADSWIVYNSGGLLGNSKFIRVDLNLGSNVTGTSYMQDTSPSSTVISLGNAHNVNASTEDYVAYCWRDTDGFQKFGTFKGNADNDGAFVYTGFRPEVVLLAPLRFSGTPHWGFHNTVSNSGFNPSSNLIDLDDEYAEYQSAGRAIDVLSNGFKARTSDAAINSTAGMAYFCWGDVPFKYGNQF